MSNWAFLEVLESLSTLSVLVAVVFYFADSSNRIKQKHYQAWQVINTAQGKGGSGGRIEALQELNHDHVPLIGVDVGSAFLQGINLRGARLSRCTFQSSDLRNSDLTNADLTFCNLRSANLRGSTLNRTQMQDADLTDADLNGSNLSGAKLDRADLTRADLRNADLSQVEWQQIASFHLANIWGVRNPPKASSTSPLRTAPFRWLPMKTGRRPSSLQSRRPPPRPVNPRGTAVLFIFRSPEKATLFPDSTMQSITCNNSIF